MLVPNRNFVFRISYLGCRISRFVLSCEYEISRRGLISVYRQSPDTTDSVIDPKETKLNKRKKTGSIKCRSQSLRLQQIDFGRLREVDLEECVFFVPGRDGDDRDAIVDLDAFLEEEHNRPFRPHLPVWRLFIINVTREKDQDQDEDSRNDYIKFTASFVYHDALGDWLSGLAFYRQFAAALNSLADHENNNDNDDDTGPILLRHATKVNSPQTPLIPPLEALHPLPVSIPYMLKAAYRHIFSRKEDDLWTGGIISLPLISRFRSMRLSAEKTSRLVAACRRQGVTVTTLLQELVAAALFRLLPSERYTRLRSVVAVSARPWLKDVIGDDDMGLFVTSLEKIHHRPAPSSSQSPRAKLSEEPAPSSLSWSSMRESRTQLQKLLSSNGKNTPAGLIRLLRDPHKYLLSRIGKRRSFSFEISNLGAFSQIKTKNPKNNNNNNTNNDDNHGEEGDCSQSMVELLHGLQPKHFCNRQRDSGQCGDGRGWMSRPGIFLVGGCCWGGIDHTNHPQCEW
ncbi:hypothetical protein VTN77DRAFT_674 [Rasamsonia byssochlamydoides]|uniref:uncharacterized protein n=1 Tax=Rasamsonia byssochlamydoides TaxID=89139 RepID=UPI0037444A1A